MYRLARSEINDYIEKTAQSNPERDEPELDEIEKELDAEIGETERRRREEAERKGAGPHKEARKQPEPERERQADDRRSSDGAGTGKSSAGEKPSQDAGSGNSPPGHEQAQREQSWTERVEARIRREREAWKQRYQGAQRKFEEATRRVEAEERRYHEWKENQRRQRQGASGRSSSSAGGGGRRSAKSADIELLKHYKNLEVSPSASKEEIKHAWRLLMRKYHPDRHANNKEKYDAATALTQELTLSYRTIIKHLEGR